MWEVYHEAASGSPDTKAVCYSLFCSLWQQLTPQLVVTRPMIRPVIQARGRTRLSVCWIFLQPPSQAILHADNCSGQNKNNTMVQYLMWRVLTGLHQSIHLHFMIAGHTKFSPDACFGLIKRKLCRTNVSSLDDLARVVEESTVCNICQLVRAQDGSTIVPSRDWAGFLSSHFCRLDGIKQYHHFRFERDHPGVVFLKKISTADEEQQVLLRGVWLPSSQNTTWSLV